VRSFFGTGEDVEFVTEVEKPLREASEFARAYKSQTAPETKLEAHLKSTRCKEAV
jgi:hypothetical protein